MPSTFKNKMNSTVFVFRHRRKQVGMQPTHLTSQMYLSFFRVEGQNAGRINRISLFFMLVYIHNQFGCLILVGQLYLKFQFIIRKKRKGGNVWLFYLTWVFFTATHFWLDFRFDVDRGVVRVSELYGFLQHLVSFFKKSS